MKPNVKGIVKHNISPEYSFKWAYVEENSKSIFVAVWHLKMLFSVHYFFRMNICIIENLKENPMKRNTYIDFLAYYGIGSAHPGGFTLTKQLLAQLPLDMEQMS